VEYPASNTPASHRERGRAPRRPRACPAVMLGCTLQLSGERWPTGSGHGSSLTHGCEHDRTLNQFPEMGRRTKGFLKELRPIYDVDWTRKPKREQIRIWSCTEGPMGPQGKVERRLETVFTGLLLNRKQQPSQRLRHRGRSKRYRLQGRIRRQRLPTHPASAAGAVHEPASDGPRRLAYGPSVGSA
jgi:hypothetical protein